jgi:hypothetical protein
MDAPNLFDGGFSLETLKFKGEFDAIAKSLAIEQVMARKGPFELSLSGSLQDDPGSFDIGLFVFVFVAPDTGFGSGVNDGILILKREVGELGIGNASQYLFDPQGRKFRVGVASQSGNGMAKFHKTTHNGPPKKPISPGDQYPHGTSFPALLARTSRWILELWRISTGKAGSGRKVVIRADIGCPWARLRIRGNSPSQGIFSSGSTQSTGFLEPAVPKPTSAVRRTPSNPVKIPSTDSV